MLNLSFTTSCQNTSHFFLSTKTTVYLQILIKYMYVNVHKGTVCSKCLYIVTDEIGRGSWRCEFLINPFLPQLLPRTSNGNQSWVISIFTCCLFGVLQKETILDLRMHETDYFQGTTGQLIVGSAALCISSAG